MDDQLPTLPDIHDRAGWIRWAKGLAEAQTPNLDRRWRGNRAARRSLTSDTKRLGAHDDVARALIAARRKAFLNE